VNVYEKQQSRILVHPAGPLTIHFWAPTFKWGITLANLADIRCAPEKISWETQLGAFNVSYGFLY
jgi:hypothetical protein